MPVVVMAYQDVDWVCLDEQLQLEGGAEARGLDFARDRGVRVGDRLGDDACGRC
jgi:hypothetical protein